MDRLVRVMHLHHRVIERRIDGLGVHHSQHRMLMVLSGMGRTASQKDIADALDISPACVARSLKALSASNLIHKAEGQDGRCRQISILPKGQRLIEDSLKTFRSIDEDMFRGVSDDEIHQLSMTLDRIQQNLALMETVHECRPRMENNTEGCAEPRRADPEANDEGSDGLI
ncbi:MAG: MarR family transcriptional regulator [Clostridia bacterium]|nr:MarR family transcriptional regulator [Clostridia bacterium]